MSQPQPKIVLISGQQGSGKTTAQQGLIKAWQVFKSHRAIAINFADPLYEMAEHVQNIAAKYGIPKKMPKDGPLLQVLGTDWGRNTIGENIWVDCLKGKINLHMVRDGLFAYDAPLVVVGDCRFRNEFDGFPDALRVRLTCDKAIRRERCTMWRENSEHASEVDLDGYCAAGKFDLYIDTGVVPTAGVVDLIVAQLQKNAWKEKRT